MKLNLTILFLLSACVGVYVCTSAGSIQALPQPKQLSISQGLRMDSSYSQPKTNDNIFVKILKLKNMNFYLQIAISLISGGFAGAFFTMAYNIKTRYWSRYFDLQKIVFENPFLYPIWDQAGDSKESNLIDKWNSDYTQWTNSHDYMNSLTKDQIAKVLTFLESWGDFILESHNMLYKSFLGRMDSGFTDRAREICISYDLFPANDRVRQKILKSSTPIRNGRNGMVYKEKSQRILGFYKIQKRT